MKSVADIPQNDTLLPDPQLIWMKSADERKKLLMDICNTIADEFIDFRYHKSECTDDEC